MPKKRFSAEQIVTMLRQIEVSMAQGKPTPVACRDAGISQQSYYRWRKEYGGLEIDQARRMKDLERENTRACQQLEIKDLHFHDLRHEGVSWLFEMGRTIPQVAIVSGHRSWSSLKRYSHLRQAGDNFAGWKWLVTIARAVVA